MKKKPGFCPVFLLVLLLTMTACSGQEESLAAAGIGIELKLPDHVQSGQKAEYIVNIRKGDRPVTGAQVVVNLEMAAMDHGKNGFRAIMTEPGQYKGQAVLPMGGDWIAYVKVKKDGQEQTKQFPFKASGDMLSPHEMKAKGLNEDGSLKNADF
jgi:hypothetical protein